MLKKVTTLRFTAVSIVVLLLALIVQMSQHEDCAWDGCYTTTHPTIASSLFGLPVLVLEVEIAIGTILLMINWLRRSK